MFDLHDLQQLEYLGDGVYVGQQDDDVVLATERATTTHYIVLDPGMYQALALYADRLWRDGEIEGAP